jgi:BirA family biotin operon repressor/biotin-[acetyl-CoA-carboxylase] ligase
MRKASEKRIVEFVSILRDASASGYVSGQVLAKKTRVSRSAVWKQIRTLRAYGYEISSTHGLGYRLINETTAPVPWLLRKLLKTDLVGKDIIYRRFADSTQTIALGIAENRPKANGTVLIAEQQKSGRGRLKRTWISPPGGLWFSVLLRPNVPTTGITVLPLVAALAVRSAIAETTGLSLSLKWPNDIVISGKKVAGILLDISAEAEVVNFVVVGIGINVNFDTRAIASMLENPQGVTSLSDELGRDVNRLELLALILNRLESYLELFERGGPDEIIREWKSHSDMLGKRVSVLQNDRVAHEGIATDVGVDGSLIIASDSGQKIMVTSGDLRIRY